MYGTRFTIFVQASLAAGNFATWQKDLTAGLFVLGTILALGEITAWAVKKVKEQWKNSNYGRHKIQSLL